MTVFLTIIAGVVVFVLGQVFLKLVLEPVQELKRTVADISHAFIEYANVRKAVSAPIAPEARDASSDIRRLSSRLHASLYLVPWYGKTAWLFRLPSEKNIREATKDLIGFSNGMYRSDSIHENFKREQRVCNALNIPSL